jgi:Tfp pilus assembly protein PilF
VLAQRQRHEEALTELRAAAAAAREPIQQYYVHLFSGQAAVDLGQYDVARDELTRAAALYPDAQAPMLGLSDLALQRGDRPAAVAALQRLQTKRDSAGPDPWWTYDRSYARDAAALAAELHNWFAVERR